MAVLYLPWTQNHILLRNYSCQIEPVKCRCFNRQRQLHRCHNSYHIELSQRYWKNFAISKEHIHAFDSATHLDIERSVRIIVTAADQSILAKYERDVALNLFRSGPAKIHQLSDELLLKLLLHDYDDFLKDSFS